MSSSATCSQTVAHRSIKRSIICTVLGPALTHYQRIEAASLSHPIITKCIRTEAINRERDILRSKELLKLLLFQPLSFWPKSSSVLSAPKAVPLSDLRNDGHLRPEEVQRHCSDVDPVDEDRAPTRFIVDHTEQVGDEAGLARTGAPEDAHLSKETGNSFCQGAVTKLVSGVAFQSLNPKGVL